MQPKNARRTQAFGRYGTLRRGGQALRHAISQPEVSVIIPLYNKRKSIARAIQSVLAQDFSDFELIVIDDGSNDGSENLIRELFNDQRLMIFSQANAGPGAARNAGAALARGQLAHLLRRR